MIKIFHLLLFIGIQANSSANILLPDFTAVYNARKKVVAIKWKHQDAGVKTYIVQKSTDNSVWTDIALQEVTRAEELRSFYFEEKKPVLGKNDYRLKCIYKDGKIEYSLIVTVQITSSNNSWVMYPVPVTELLTLEYRGSEPIQGVINVVIQNLKLLAMHRR